MKVTIEQAALLKALGHVYRVVERRNTIPILSNVLIRAEERQAVAEGDRSRHRGDRGDRRRGGQPGATTVPAHVLHDIVRKLPDGAQVSLEQTGDGGQLLLRSGRSRFTLQSLPASDFPDLAAGTMSHTLRGGRHRTAPAGGKDPVRRLDRGDALLPQRHLPACGRRPRPAPCCVRWRPTAIVWRRPTLRRPGAAGMPGVIVPKKTVGEVQKLLAEAQRRCAGRTVDCQDPLFLGSVVFTSKLIDGTFPDYGRVIPTKNDKRLTVELAEFARSVDRVSTISSERGRAVKLALGDGKLTLSVNNPTPARRPRSSRSTTRMPRSKSASTPATCSTSPSSWMGDTALFKLAEPGSPTLIQDREGAPNLYVLMPMRV
jgi:DNA polymerase-3 subunit beta